MILKVLTTRARHSPTIFPSGADPSMNVSTVLLQIFRPAQAARIAAEARMASAPGCELKPLGALLARVANAGHLRGEAFTSEAARQLRSHMQAPELTPRQVMNRVSAVKHQQRDILRDLMQRSAGARGGSAHARQIAATREVVHAVRHLSWEVRVAPAPALQGDV